MKVYQAFNHRIKAFVKFKITRQGAKILDVKQREPTRPFKGVPIKGR